jgi:hypothetical protein
MVILVNNILLYIININFDKLNEDDEKINSILREAGKRPRNY